MIEQFFRLGKAAELHGLKRERVLEKSGSGTHLDHGPRLAIRALPIALALRDLLVENMVLVRGETVPHGVELSGDRHGSVALTEQSMENRGLDARGVKRRVEVGGAKKVDERLTVVDAPDALAGDELAVRIVRRRPGSDAYPRGESGIHERSETADRSLPNAFDRRRRIGGRAAGHVERVQHLASANIADLHVEPQRAASFVVRTRHHGTGAKPCRECRRLIRLAERSEMRTSNVLRASRRRHGDHAALLESLRHPVASDAADLAEPGIAGPILEPRDVDALRVHHRRVSE